MIRLKYIVSFQKGRIPTELFSQPAPSKIPYLSMEYLRGQTTAPEYAEQESSIAANDGDMILLWDGSNAGEFIKAKHGVVSSTGAVASVRNVDPGFFFYLCKFLEPQIRAETIGMGIPHVNGEFLGNLSVDIPPKRKQFEIATFLNEQTSRIDKLITSKQHLLNLLTEKRRTLITQAVTKGMDSSVAMKDSGILWLGNIPAHWAIERSKWLLKERDERSKFGEEELLTVSHLTGVTTRAEKDVNMFMAESLEGYKCCKRGDLVINTLWAWMGAMGVARQDGIVSPAYHVYEPTPNIEPDYLDYLVRMPVFTEEVTRYSKGVWSSRLRLYPEGLYEVWLPVPPIEEQKTIAAYLKTETAKLTNLATTTERTIKLLQERRAGLISDAVTGKIPIESMNLSTEESHAN